MTSCLQDWVMGLTVMQQSVLIECTRGPDNVAKYATCKFLLRWYRRCILVSAFDGGVLNNPVMPGGGSFTGPSFGPALDKAAAFAIPVDYDWRPDMDELVSEYLKGADAIPHHFYLHFMHAVEIVGYKHPNSIIRDWWKSVYERFVHDMHVWPELEDELDSRLGDSRSGWLARADKATRA